MTQNQRKNILDHIIEEMIGVVEKSQDEIFNISEEAREEYDYLLNEFEETKVAVAKYIKNGATLEQKVRASRQRLSQVSKGFEKYSEKDIRKVYDTTYDLQIDLAVFRREKSVLRDRRDELERRIISLSKTIDRATSLTSKIPVILTYLNEEFSEVNDMIESAKVKQEFSLRIIEAQEEERGRISREIHDGPAQMLANILLRSELIERAYRGGSAEQALKELKSVREMIRTSLSEVRRIIYDLRPMALDDLGLVPTINKYLTKTGEYSEIQLEFILIGESKRLPQKYEVSLFRLMQESVQNAINHAKASLIKVKLEITDQNLFMTIQDDGIGFDPLEKRDSDSFGLVGMKERVEMLAGTLTINSIKQNGTNIYINIPYES